MKFNVLLGMKKFAALRQYNNNTRITRSASGVTTMGSDRADPGAPTLKGPSSRYYQFLRETSE